jgi:hypothetical protein
MRWGGATEEVAGEEDRGGILGEDGEGRSGGGRGRGERDEKEMKEEKAEEEWWKRRR